MLGDGFSHNIIKIADSKEIWICAAIDTKLYLASVAQTPRTTHLRWTIDDINCRHREAVEKECWESDEFLHNNHPCTLMFRAKCRDSNDHSPLQRDFLYIVFKDDYLLRQSECQSKVWIENADGACTSVHNECHHTRRATTDLRHLGTISFHFAIHFAAHMSSRHRFINLAYRQHGLKAFQLAYVLTSVLC